MAKVLGTAFAALQRSKSPKMKGPSRKEDVVQQKPVIRHDYNGKEICKIKCKNNPLPSTYDEAKACCKARKRKERQESISSLCQERKVIRSNSEERPSQRKHIDSKASMRRVSSSEDFQKSSGDAAKTLLFDKIDGLSPKQRQSSTDIILIYEDFEHERRRCNERFSKPLTLKNKKAHKSRRPKARCLPKPKFKPEMGGAAHDNPAATAKHEMKNQDAQIEDGSTICKKGETTSAVEPAEAKFLELHADSEKERSPSPVRSSNISPDLDLTTLHEQVDCSEPLLSCANHTINENTETMPGLSVASQRLLSSPRNSIIASHRIYLDPDLVPHGNFLDGQAQNPLEMRLQKITKQINSVKKKIKKYETEFETQHGYKVSHADKLNDKNIRRLYMELTKLKKEQKQLVDVCPGTTAVEGDVTASPKTAKNLQDTLNEIERKLALKRDVGKRTSIIEQMSNDELAQEKIAVQKALLYLESIHGRPDSKEDRDMVRSIYDRYRNLKRTISKVQANSVGNELATIHEDETMHFITTFPSQVTEMDSEKSSVLTSTDSSDTDTSISENLHALSKAELIEQHRMASEEKKEYRREIKTFEAEFQQNYGRMVQKEDKLLIEHVYVGYKKIKAKLKLLDALVGKQF